MSRRDGHLFAAGKAAQLGLPPIEFRFDIPAGLVVTELDPDPTGGVVMVLSVEERDPSGRRIGWLELGLFSAPLIIDRTGALQEAATRAAAGVLSGPGRGRLMGQGDIELGGGASGYRVDAVLQLDKDGRFRPDCPYVSWLALAGRDAVVRAGLFAVIRSARPDWRAGAELLDSLEVAGSGTAGGVAGGVSPGADLLHLPLVRRR